jgi:hypothetical protein
MMESVPSEGVVTIVVGNSPLFVNGSLLFPFSTNEKLSQWSMTLSLLLTLQVQWRTHRINQKLIFLFNFLFLAFRVR